MRSFYLMLAMVAFIATGLHSNAQEGIKRVSFQVDELPEYPGNKEALINDIKAKLKYPEEAIKQSIKGEVYVMFVVNNTGKIESVSIARGVGPELDKEALTVINQLDKTWKPGILNGKPVDVSVTVRIDFKEDETMNVTVLNMGKLKKEETSEITFPTKSILTESDIPKVIVEEEVFFIVEDMPEFPGGDIALRKFLANAVKYPPLASNHGIQGKVYVTFIVGKDGSVTNASIARGVHPLLDKEAIRVVNSLPKWKPGKQRGKPINVSYTIPIDFSLK